MTPPTMADVLEVRFDVAAEPEFGDGELQCEPQMLANGLHVSA